MEKVSIPNGRPREFVLKNGVKSPQRQPHPYVVVALIDTHIFKVYGTLFARVAGRFAFYRFDRSGVCRHRWKERWAAGEESSVRPSGETTTSSVDKWPVGDGPLWLWLWCGGPSSEQERHDVMSRDAPW
jgi:hypothetical protein